MNRREFVILVGGMTAAWPRAAGAKQSGKLPVIGFLGSSTASSQSQWTAAFERRLRELGWIAGRTVTIEYDAGQAPRIASRLQDFFGMVDGPRVGADRTPLVLELLAPNHRAVQVTTDLAGFWQRHYPAIRKELVRKYPKHSWPEDPTKVAPRMGAR